MIAVSNDFVNTQNLLNDKYSCFDHIKFFFNIKLKYEPKRRSYAVPLFFLLLSVVLIGSISYSLTYHDEYMVVFYIQ